MIRVLVVARSAAVRTRLEASLARQPDVLVAGSAEWRPENGAAEREPDVVLLVLERGDEPRLDPSAAPAPSATRLVVLGPEPMEQWAADALRRGARAVLPLDVSSAELGATLDAVAAGLAVMPPAIAGAARPRVSRRLGTQTARQSLTPREIEILGLLAAGLGNKAIATRLGISGHTVKTHVVSFFEKLGVSTRAEAVAAGVRRGILML
ncbi:MAG: LuxR C-terminal-related transcriptional regulator [Gemmatimonadales bacterium]